jgi:hypothetical protein
MQIEWIAQYAGEVKYFAGKLSVLLILSGQLFS